MNLCKINIVNGDSLKLILSKLKIQIILEIFILGFRKSIQSIKAGKMESRNNQGFELEKINACCSDVYLKE